MKPINPEDILINAIYKGGMKLFIRLSQILFSAYLLIALIGYFSGQYDKDSTDSPNSRNGLRIHTDNLTGCQYLSTISGDITPRLTESNTHYGCKK